MKAMTDMHLLSGMMCLLDFLILATFIILIYFV